MKQYWMVLKKHNQTSKYSFDTKHVGNYKSLREALEAAKKEALKAMKGDLVQVFEVSKQNGQHLVTEITV